MSDKTGEGGLARRPEQQLAIVPRGLASRSLSDIGVGERVLKFPDRPVGTLYTAQEPRLRRKSRFLYGPLQPRPNPKGRIALAYKETASHPEMFYADDPYPYVEYCAAKGTVRISRHKHPYVSLSLDAAIETGLRSLRYLGNDALDELDLYGVAGEEVLSGISHLTSLKSLDLSLAEISGTGEGLIAISHLAGLECLYFSYPRSGHAWKQNSSNLASDLGLRHLAQLYSLRELFLTGGLLTDLGLSRLASLTELRALDISRTNITNTGLSQLGALVQLENLDLSGTRITDKGMRLLGSLPNLRDLSLADLPITNAGLLGLGTLTRLRYLNLSGTRITDRGLMVIAGLSGLEMLILSNTNVTNAGLAHLVGMARLDFLDLQGTKVTNAGLPHLAQLSALECWFPPDTGVAQGGLDAYPALKKIMY